MPRCPRLHIDGMPVHVVQRGHNRAECFRSPLDRRQYLELLQEALVATGCMLHAFVLMTNHVHLLLTPRRAGDIALLMMTLGRRYVRRFNDRWQRSGTLWEGRYHSSLIDSDHYLLACHRYIESNPVRAGLAASAGSYHWSSHRTNATGEPTGLLTPHPTYLALGATPEDRGRAYVRIFEREPDPAAIERIRVGLRQNLPTSQPKRKLGRPRRNGMELSAGAETGAHDGSAKKGAEKGSGSISPHAPSNR